MQLSDYAFTALQKDVQQLRSIVRDMINPQEDGRPGLDFITFKQLAERFPGSKDMLYRLTSKNLVPGQLKQGRRLIFLRSITEKWLKELERERLQKASDNNGN